jgi:RNA polymerase sigma-70 factor (ECF subfamily)
VPTEELEAVFRREWPRLVARAFRVAGDLDTAEEIVQDAMVAALNRWPFAGVPDNPAAWLMTAVRNGALNRIRGRARAERREASVALPESAWDEVERESGTVPDDRLSLIFTCCHPVLGQDSQVALTLRLVGGLATGQIARAFLVPETTIAQRIVRAKRLIKERQVPYAVPRRHELDERLPAVLAVIYLVFNEGYLATAGRQLMRSDLCDEALRLALLLGELLPGEREVGGLLALLHFQLSRRAARTDAEGTPVTLEHQDRAGWDRTHIDAGERVLHDAWTPNALGPYMLQAAIAGCHARASSWETTDWPAILRLYDRLYLISPTAVVALNRAVAVSMAEGPAQALGALKEVEATGVLDGYHLFWAAQGDFLRRLGRVAEAAEAYQKAIALASNEAEATFLGGRLIECQAFVNHNGGTP